MMPQYIYHASQEYQNAGVGPVANYTTVAPAYTCYTT